MHEYRVGSCFNKKSQNLRGYLNPVPEEDFKMIWICINQSMQDLEKTKNKNKKQHKLKGELSPYYMYILM